MKIFQKQKTDCILLVLITLLLTIPFVHKPLHNDDNAWVIAGRAVLNHPFNPYGEAIQWMENVIALGNGITHPPLIPYYTALMLHVNDSLLWLNISFLLFPLLAAIAMYFLAKEFTDSPFLSSLLLVSSGSFLVMSNSIHTDVAMLAFYILAVITYIYGFKNNSVVSLVFSGISISMAVMTSYQSLSLLPLLGFYSLMKKDKVCKVLFVFSIPLSFFFIWCLQNYIYFGEIHFVNLLKNGIQGEGFLTKGVYVLTSIGGANVFFIFLLISFWNNRFLFLYILLLIVSIVVTMYIGTEYSMLQMGMLIAFFYAGAFVILNLILETWEKIKNKKYSTPNLNDIFLLVWAGGIFFYSIFFMHFGAARYLLPFLPPLILLFVKQVEKITLRKKYKELFVFFAVSISMLQGVLMNFSDYEFSKIPKEQIESIYYKYGKDNKLFFTGLVASQTFLKKMGALPLSRINQRIKKGDIIVVAKNEAKSIAEKDLVERERMELIDIVSSKGSIPMLIASNEAKAGFYHNSWGLLPYSLSTAPVEEYRIYKVLGASWFIENLANAEIDQKRIFIDLGSEFTRFNLMKGWSWDEQWEDGTTAVWAEGIESRIAFYSSALTDKTLSFKAIPFTYNGSETQEVKLYVNDKFVKMFSVKEGWNQYDINVPGSFFLKGENIITFRFKYATSPFLNVRKNSDARKLTAAFDFVILYDGKKMESNYQEGENVTRARFTINGEYRQVLYQYPNSKITYNLLINDHAILNFGIGIDQSAWEKEGDGVTFELYAQSPNSGIKKIFSKYIDPKNNISDRKWFDETVSLKEFEGEHIKLTFSTKYGPSNDKLYDYSGWSTPTLNP